MVAKFTSQPKNKEVVTKINEVIDAMGTVKKVNNASPDSNGNVSLTIPTDTQDTCGATNSTEKLYLVGRTAQSTGTSNSNSSVYTQSGYLYAKTPSASSNTTAVATTKWVMDKGYTSNTGTVTSVNNVSPVNGNVSITIPDVSNYLQNTATGSNALTVGGTASAYTGGTNIGISSQAKQNYGTALGYNTNANGNSSTCIGRNAGTSAASAIQIGAGVNSTANTLQVGFIHASTNYKLLDGTTGLIPLDRIAVMGGAGSSSAGTKGLVPAPASGDNSKFLRGDGTWQSVSAGSGANIDLSNLSATGKTVIDGQWSINQVINLITSNTTINNGAYKDYTLTDIPQDGYNYEVIGYAVAQTGAASGRVAMVGVHSSVIYEGMRVCATTTTANSAVYTSGSFTIPIGSDRVIYIDNLGPNPILVNVFRIVGYRRIGTNT